jgi:drug/metabolite transporter (DMT)-like permease
MVRVTGPLLAFLSSILFGASDFLAGVAARVGSVLRVTLVAYIGAAIMAIGVELIAPGRWSSAAVTAGIVAGIASAVAFVLFYASLVLGPIGVAAAIVAASEAIPPILVEVVWHGGRPSALAWTGIIVAIAGGIILGLAEGGRGVRPTQVVVATIAGLTFGIAIVALDAGPVAARFAPANLQVWVGLVLLAVATLAVSRSPRVADAVGRVGLHDGTDRLPQRVAMAAFAAGLLLMAADLALVSALHTGSLAQVGVIVGLNPLTSILLAWLFIKEKLRPVQGLGIGVALLGATALALG